MGCVRRNARGGLQRRGRLGSAPRRLPSRHRCRSPQVYKEFREQFDARQYAEAQPLAEKLVALTEEQYGDEDLALANPLTNLATIHYRLKDFPAAEKDYQRTLRILQADAGTTDRQLLRPLHGLGASHFARERIRRRLGAR